MGRSLYGRVRDIIESARQSAARSVNTAQVISNWLIGREIVEEQQHGRAKAGYGERLLTGLSTRLRLAYGPGYSVDNLEFFRRFFISYPRLIPSRKNSYPAGRKLGDKAILHPLGGESTPFINDAISEPLARKSADRKIGDPAGSQSWRPGVLNPNLAWRHYQALLRVSETGARCFYELEAIKNSWSGRELERQINSLLYERLALSKDKSGLMKLATEGHEVRRPEDAFKDPVVMEFLGLPKAPQLSESGLEGALIANLRQFLLELGKGFAFVSRQERLSLDGDHFYVDLVFYHAVLKCYVLIDLKVGKLTHQDLGQMQLYVNYFDAERRSAGDGPTLGLILCTDKNDAAVRYTLGRGRRKIFASRYKLHLPTEAELAAELRRELSEYRRR